MKISYNQFCELADKSDNAAQMIIHDLKLESPEKYRIFQEAYEKAKATKKPVTDGLSLVYEDVTNYEQFKETLIKSRTETEYRWGERIYTQKLQRFREKNRDLYLEFTKRLNQEYRKGRC